MGIDRDTIYIIGVGESEVRKDTRSRQLWNGLIYLCANLDRLLQYCLHKYILILRLMTKYAHVCIVHTTKLKKRSDVSMGVWISLSALELSLLGADWKDLCSRRVRRKAAVRNRLDFVNQTTKYSKTNKNWPIKTFDRHSLERISHFLPPSRPRSKLDGEGMIFG